MTKQKNKNQTRLFYLYDKEADVFYLSQGKPSSRDRVLERDDVLLRTNPKTGLVRGFTILNFSHGFKSKSLSPISLPILSDWVAA